MGLLLSVVVVSSVVGSTALHWPDLPMSFMVDRRPLAAKLSELI